MKQNSCPIVGEVATPTRIGLDKLDGTIEAFGTGVADSVLAEVKQPLFVTPECYVSRPLRFKGMKNPEYGRVELVNFA